MNFPFANKCASTHWHGSTYIDTFRIRLRCQRSDLNEHLHRGRNHDTGHCPYCPLIMEDVQHFLMDCPQYAAARLLRDRTIHAAAQRTQITPELLLGEPTGPLTKAQHSTIKKAIDLYLTTAAQTRFPGKYSK